MLARRLFFVWGAAAIVIAASTSLGNTSCQGFPDGECRADRTNAFVSQDAGAALADPCTRCMQSSCCEQVGTCLQGDASCADEMKDAQACVVAGGQKEEPRCKSALVSGASQSLYSCTRANCGAQCGVPSCDLDPAVTLIVTPDCDRCVGGSCCSEINSCYGNRQCKLFLECISTRCPNTFGPSISIATAAPPGLLETTRDRLCNSGAPPAEEVRPSACFQRCLDEFAPVTGASSNPDDRAARCLAFGVFTCAARADCGRRCYLDGGIRDGIYDEDRVSDGRAP